MVDSKAWIGPLVVVVLILAAGYLVAYPTLASQSQTQSPAATVEQTNTVTVTATATGASPAGSSGQATTVTVTTALSSSLAYTVNLAYKAGIGFYLVDSSGLTLYFRATDPGNGTSTCTGGCITFWPVFYAGPGPIVLPPNLSASSFGNVTRPDGKLQTSFDGYPLYYFPTDKAPGQTTGEGKSNFYACCTIPGTTSSSTTSG